MFVLVVLLGAISFIEPALSDIGPGTWVHIRRQAPQDDIKSIFHDHRGNIWVGTRGSFHAFDGNRWKRYTYERNVLDSHTPFLIDSESRLYFIDNNELAIWDDGMVTRYTDVKVGYPAVGVFSDDSILYMGSYHVSMGGIYSFDGETVTKMREGRTRSLTIDNAGRLWATTIDPDTGDMQLIVLEGGMWSDRSEEIQFLYPVTTNELTVQCAPGGAVWVSNLGKYGIFRDGEWKFQDGGGVPVFLRFDISGITWGYGYKKLYTLDSNGVWEQVLAMESGTTNSPQFLAVTPDSSVWTFDSSTVYRYTDDEWVVVKSSLDLASDIITCFEYTENGELMCGHGLRDLEFSERKRHGISILSDTTWYNYNRYKDVDLLNVYQLKRMPDGGIMAYTDGGFKMFYRGKWDEPDSLEIRTQTDMDWDSYETLWFTSEVGLIEFLDPNARVHNPFGNEEYLIPVHNLFIDDVDVLYMQITLTNNIVSYDGDEWNTVVEDNGLTNDFALADDGTIWASRQNNLAYWDKGEKKWKPVVSLDHGRFIHIDNEERIWASGFGNTGYLENGTWHPIPELSEFASDVIAISDDGRVALNVFDRERKNFYGLFEFVPSTAVSRSEERPVSFITAGSHPNPFNAHTTIFFELPFTAKVAIAVYSVTGQHVKTIADRRFAAGKHSVVWDAISETGNISASGVYFYRIAAKNSVTTGKMLLVR